MASKAIQMVFVVLGAVGVMGVITCCSLPEWVVLYYDTETHVGLWKTCVKQRTGLQVCTFETIAKVSPLPGSQAMIVFSCMFGILSLLLLFCGVHFTTCIQNQDNKTKMILAAGVGLVLTGLLLIIPVNWCSNAPVVGGKLGACIYLGYLAGLMLILTGVLLCCFGRPESRSFGEIISCYRNTV